MIPAIHEYHLDTELKGAILTGLIKRLKEIDGITNVSHRNRYEFSIIKGELFSWDNIDRDVLVLIKAVLPSEPLTIDTYVDSKCFHCGAIK